jgi:ABC-2 type transport system ATP-binding protein
MRVEYRNVHKAFRDQVVLDGFSLEVGPGSVVLLMGPNGCGKSTALLALLGLVRPDSGSVLLDDVPYAQLPGGPRRVGACLGMTCIDQELTARQVLELRAATLGAPRESASAALLDAGLDRAGSKRLRLLSTGMQTRALIAAATLGTPEVLVLDEPFANLDAEGRDWLRLRLDDVRARGGVALIATHHRETYDVGDRWIDMETGEITPRRNRKGGRRVATRRA